MEGTPGQRLLRGTVAAAVTPLRSGGASLDEEAIGPYVDFLIAGGVDGVLALGSTGEGILFAPAERRRVVEAFVRAAGGRLPVAAHCGAQTTRDSIELAVHAVSAGADAVAVIGPPYFRLTPREQLLHLQAVARACAPTPFYVYQFTAVAGYPFDVDMLRNLRLTEENFVGIKVSDTPWEAFRRYLLDGLDVLVGPEALLDRGMAHGAVGAVSALASAFPDRVAAAVASPSAEAAHALGQLRSTLEGTPRHAGLKRVLARRGVPVKPDVRAPLRDLTREEQRGFDAWLDSLSLPALTP